MADDNDDGHHGGHHGRDDYDRYDRFYDRGGAYHDNRERRPASKKVTIIVIVVFVLTCLGVILYSKFHK